MPKTEIFSKNCQKLSFFQKMPLADYIHVYRYSVNRHDRVIYYSSSPRTVIMLCRVRVVERSHKYSPDQEKQKTWCQCHPSLAMRFLSYVRTIVITKPPSKRHSTHSTLKVVCSETLQYASKSACVGKYLK